MTDRETLDAMLRRRPGLDPKERGAIRSLLERLEAAEAEVEAGKIATGTPIPNETWVDAVSRLEAAEREPYRVVWKIVEKLGLNEGGGCPDSRIINEVERLRAVHETTCRDTSRVIEDQNARIEAALILLPEQPEAAMNALRGEE